MAKAILVVTFLGFPTDTSRKLQLVKIVSISEVTHSNHYMIFPVKNFWFYSLDWLEFFHQDGHREIFLPKRYIFSNEFLDVHSIVFVAP